MITPGPDPAAQPALGPGEPVRRLAVPYLSLVPSDPAAAAAREPWADCLCRVAEARDREAFARLFAHFAPRVKTYLVRTGSSDDLAEELAQETMVAVWRKSALFDPARAAASTWIFTIARRLRIDAFRRGQLDLADEAPDFDAFEADQPAADEAFDATRGAERVRRAMEQLPPEQREVLLLSFFEDEPHARIAETLRIPLGTVKSRVRLAVTHLRRLLQP